ncbi:MAG: hypothetical protein ACYDDF_13090 [Thermoplasmatota archaeon]
MADALAVNATVFLEIVTFGLSFLLFVVSALSWYRIRNLRLGAVTAAFGLLAARSGWASWNVVTNRTADLTNAAIDALILFFFYLSVAQR